MPTTVVERYGSLSATGLAKEATFGTPLTPTVFLPMSGNGLELDPGLFSPKVMMGVRDVNSFPLYGQNKISGSISGPLFPSQGINLLAGAIGQDAPVGSGVTGTGSASPNTLNGTTTAGATTVTLTSATGYTNGSFIQVDVNATTTTSEVRKITNVSTNTLTLDAPLVYGHLTGAVTKVVTAPFTHTIKQANSLPSFTVEKNLGNFESLQLAGAKVNKYGLQVQTSNQEAQVSVDMQAKSAAVLSTPTAITIVNENPYVFPEVTASIFGTTVTQASSVDLSIENGLKDTYTFNASHNLQFLTPVTLKCSAKIDLVFTSLDDVDWGYWTRMVNGAEGALAITLTHPSSAGTVTINLPRNRIRTYGDSVKMEDVIMTSLQFDTYLDFSTLTEINATVVTPTVWVAF